MHLLPTGLVPLDLAFTIENEAVHHELWIAGDDHSPLTESKRWKAVYLYATEGREPPWEWSGPMVGSVPLSALLNGPP